jgi:hypothetical protein
MSTAPYYVQSIFTFVIVNPDNSRQPLPKGLLSMEKDFLEKALTYSGFALHTFDPLQVIDKIGYVKQGDDAAELTLDALQAYLQYQIANGGKMMTMQDIVDAIQQGMDSGDDD